MATENKTVEKTKVEKVDVNLDDIFGGAPGAESVTLPEESTKPNIFSKKQDVDISFLEHARFFLSGRVREKETNHNIKQKTKQNNIYI